jgi:hypothetical protein
MSLRLDCVFATWGTRSHGRCELRRPGTCSLIARPGHRRDVLERKMEYFHCLFAHSESTTDRRKMTTAPRAACTLDFAAEPALPSSGYLMSIQILMGAGLCLSHKDHEAQHRTEVMLIKPWMSYMCSCCRYRLHGSMNERRQIWLQARLCEFDSSGTVSILTRLEWRRQC